MNKAEKYKVFYEERLQSGIGKFMVDGKLNFDTECYDFVTEIAHSILEQETVPFEMSLLFQTQLFIFDDSVLFVSFLHDPYKISTYTKKEFDDLAEKHRQWGEKLLKEAELIQARSTSQSNMSKN